MEGWMTYLGTPRRRLKFGSAKTAASYWLTNGRKNIPARRRLQGGCGRVEARIAAGDLPRGVDAEVGHHRHERLQDLRGPRAETPAREVQEPAPPHALGQRENDVDHARRRDAAIILDAD